MSSQKSPFATVSLRSPGGIEMAPSRETTSGDLERVPSEQDGLLQDEGFYDHLNAKPDPHRTTRIKLYAAVFIANLAFQILGPAQTRIFEQIFCNQHYRIYDPSRIPASGLVPEDECKNAAIQWQLALLRSVYEVLDALPALIMSIPLGIAMDTIGRRPLLLIGISTVAAQQFWIAFVCTLNGAIPLRAIWLAPLLNFFSGGLIVLVMVFHCIVCDVTSKETLATSLFRLTAVGECTKVLGPFIAGVLMQFDVWWAICVGLACLVGLVGICWTVPETLVFEPKAIEVIPSPTNTPSRSTTTYLAQIKRHLASMSVVTSSPQLLVLILLSPFIQFGATLPDILQQYISVRYNWSLANSTFLFSLQGTAASFSLFLLLPWLSTYLSARFVTLTNPTSLNATIARLSLLLVSLAWVLEGLAPTITILIVGLALETLGLGGPAALKALAATLVEAKDNGRIFAVLAVAQVLSTVVAHPLTAMLFGAGLDKGGGVYLGMPFFVAALGTAVSCVVLSCVRFRKVDRVVGDEEEEVDEEEEEEALSGGAVLL